MENVNIGAILGPVIGVLGGLIGTYFSIKNTHGPRERRLMINAAIACWGLLAILAVAVMKWPAALRWFFIPYLILLTVGIVFLNRKQQAIRCEETGVGKPDA